MISAQKFLQSAFICVNQRQNCYFSFSSCRCISVVKKQLFLTAPSNSSLSYSNGSYRCSSSGAGSGRRQGRVSRAGGAPFAQHLSCGVSHDREPAGCGGACPGDIP